MKKIIDELDNGVIIITPNNTKKEILKYLTDNSGKKEDLSKYDYEGHELEKTLNIKPLSDEIKKNAEFLRALKEFRNNL